MMQISLHHILSFFMGGYRFSDYQKIRSLDESLSSHLSFNLAFQL